MIRSFLLRLSRAFSRFVFWAGVLCLTALALVRLGVWAAGSPVLSPDLIGPPQITKWRMDHPRFGGLSALIMAPDGASLVAGGDRGSFVEAPLNRDATGALISVGPARLTRALLRSGTPRDDFTMDLEALTPAPQGGWFTAFEGITRIEWLAGAGGHPHPTHEWDQFAALFTNHAFEALATLPDDRVIAITETGSPADSVIWNGEVWQAGPKIPVRPGYRITGADVGPDGCLYLLERRYGLASGFTFGLRRLSGGPGDWRDTLLYHAAPASLGNAEGLSLWQSATGQMRASVITDDGFWPLTPTRLIEFPLTPGMGCGFAF